MQSKNYNNYYAAHNVYICSITIYTVNLTARLLPASIRVSGLVSKTNPLLQFSSQNRIRNTLAVAGSLPFHSPVYKYATHNHAGRYVAII